VENHQEKELTQLVEQTSNQIGQKLIKSLPESDSLMGNILKLFIQNK
jgi:hypothetical protein